MSWNLEEAIGWYSRQGAPKDQSALVSLLKEVQQESGGRIPPRVLPVIAEAYAVRESYLLALIRRLPSLRLEDRHTLELCAGPNCGKASELARYAEILCKEKGIELKFVPCMRHCAKGPNLRYDGELHHQATKQLLKQLTEE